MAEIYGPVLEVTESAALVRDDLTPEVDGVRSEFELTHAFASGSVLLYLNGLLQSAPDDYAEREDINSVDFVEPPLIGDTVAAIYARGG